MRNRRSVAGGKNTIASDRNQRRSIEPRKNPPGSDLFRLLDTLPSRPPRNRLLRIVPLRNHLPTTPKQPNNYHSGTYRRRTAAPNSQEDRHLRAVVAESSDTDLIVLSSPTGSRPNLELGGGYRSQPTRYKRVSALISGSFYKRSSTPAESWAITSTLSWPDEMHRHFIELP